jgi:hypothetical protein
LSDDASVLVHARRDFLTTQTIGNQTVSELDEPELAAKGTLGSRFAYSKELIR